SRDYESCPTVRKLSRFIGARLLHVENWHLESLRERRSSACARPAKPRRCTSKLRLRLRQTRSIKRCVIRQVDHTAAIRIHHKHLPITRPEAVENDVLSVRSPFPVGVP